MHLYPLPAQGAYNVMDLLADSRFCRGRYSDHNIDKIGVPVFADQHRPTALIASTAPGFVGDDARKTELPLNKPFRLIAIGCVRYFSGSDPKPHFTGIALLPMRKVTGDAANPVFNASSLKRGGNEVLIRYFPIGDYAN